MQRKSLLHVCVALFALTSYSLAQKAVAHTNPKLRFEISFPASLESKPLDGHIMLCISTEAKPEPRYQLREETAQSGQFFGLDVEGLAPGSSAIIDSTTLGYPLRSVNEIPAGDYYVQAVLNVYETFHRADGHTLKLPPEMGEGQQWYRKPGNPMSTPVKMHIDPAAGGVIRISMAEKVPPVEAPKDTKYVKHFRIQSKLLS